MKALFRAILTGGLLFASLKDTFCSEHSLQLLVRTGTNVAGALVTDISDYNLALTDTGEFLYQGSTPTATGLFGRNNAFVLIAPPNSFGGSLARSNSGAVAYTASVDNKWRVYYNSTVMIETGDAFDAIETVQGTGFVALGPQGALAYTLGSLSRTSLTAPGFKLITGTSFFGRQIVGFNEPPAINGSGTLVFNASYTGPGGNGLVGLFTPSGPLVSHGDMIGGVPIGGSGSLGISSSPSINSRGEVAFLAYSNFVPHVFTQHALIAAPGQVIEGRTLSSISGHPAINDHGRVVFFAAFSEGGSGYVADGRVVAQTGQTVGGFTITGFGSTRRPALNVFGQVLFYVTFQDGSQGLVLATPLPKCEIIPASSSHIRLKFTGALQQSSDLKTWQDVTPSPLSNDLLPKPSVPWFYRAWMPSFP